VKNGICRNDTNDREDRAAEKNLNETISEANYF